MVAWFYSRYSTGLLVLALLVGAFLTHQALTLPADNSIEAWLDQRSAAYQVYDEFKAFFGAEEVILIAVRLDRPYDEIPEADRELLQSLCERLRALPGIRSCWTPEDVIARMAERRVPRAEAEQRLRGLLISDDRHLVGLLARLSEQGLADRPGVVADVRRELRYCRFSDHDVMLAGAPVVLAELDRLGNREENQKYFTITLLICLGLLYYSLRQWSLAFFLLGLTVWAIHCTLGIIHLCGGQMNFVLDALPVMVMVFTLAIAIHFLHYYADAAGEPDPLSAALRRAAPPCLFATITTVIGLLSLVVSDMQPVRQFGLAAALGALIALIGGLGLTPAILTLWPPLHLKHNHHDRMCRTAMALLTRHGRRIAALCLVPVAVAAVGITHLQSKIDPLDFLPSTSRVRRDVLTIHDRLTNTDSLEVVAVFTDESLPLIERLREVRRLENRIRRHCAVRHVMSAATFFPVSVEDGVTASGNESGSEEFVADGYRLWRISVRLRADADRSPQDVFHDLQRWLADEPVVVTGLAPLLEQSQREIFDGFWQSFATAFFIITAVMIVALRSVPLGLLAMVPNLTPICLVFGTIGWLGQTVDIGMMMSGSIALGIAVDGTFHFLVRYRNELRSRRSSAQAAMAALDHTGPPILQATIVAAVGMMALTLSQFGPTVRFGYIMSAMLLAALVGDLVLLPALLCLGRLFRFAIDDDDDQRSSRVAQPTPSKYAPLQPLPVPASHVAPAATSKAPSLLRRAVRGT
ncbi:MAG: RND transporter [Planctomycetota bacterium]|nr:MAG: RND transporter [Planctomycetota bacterium]